MNKFTGYLVSQSARYANYTSPTSAQPSYYQASPSCNADDEVVWMVVEPVVVPHVGTAATHIEPLGGVIDIEET